MMEKVPTVVEKTQHYPPHLKKVLKTYQKSAIKSLQGPSTVLSNAAATEVDRERELNGVFKKEPESSPELPLETPPPSQPPSASVPQVPILSTADQSAELSETLIEGQRISCFIIGGEKRICFVQLLSTVLRNVQAYMINNVVSELFINFSSCNSEQLSALKAKGLLPAETPSCGLVTKPDAERLCSVLLHEGGASPDGIDKHSEYSSFIVYHECFSGAKGVLYYEFYNKENWCVQCVVCRRLFTPQMFVCHSCYMDKKRNSVHTLIETNICHWGFDSTNWPRYIHVLEEQPAYKKYTQILQTFKENHRRSELIPLKRKQILSAEPNDVDKVKTEESAITGAGLAVTTTATVTTTTTITTPKVERADDEDEDDERWYLKKKAKVTVSASVEDGPPLVSCSGVPAYYNFHSYYSNLCESWVRNAAVAAGYHNHHHHPATSWPNYPPIPFTKDSKSYYFTDSTRQVLDDRNRQISHSSTAEVPLSRLDRDIIHISEAEFLSSGLDKNCRNEKISHSSRAEVPLSRLDRDIIHISEAEFLSSGLDRSRNIGDTPGEVLYDGNRKIEDAFAAVASSSRFDCDKRGDVPRKDIYDENRKIEAEVSPSGLNCSTPREVLDNENRKIENPFEPEPSCSGLNLNKSGDIPRKVIDETRQFRNTPEATSSVPNCTMRRDIPRKIIHFKKRSIGNSSEAGASSSGLDLDKSGDIPRKVPCLKKRKIGNSSKAEASSSGLDLDKNGDIPKKVLRFGKKKVGKSSEAGVPLSKMDLDKKREMPRRVLQIKKKKIENSSEAGPSGAPLSGPNNNRSVDLSREYLHYEKRIVENSSEAEAPLRKFDYLRIRDILRKYLRFKKRILGLSPEALKKSRDMCRQILRSTRETCENSSDAAIPSNGLDLNRRGDVVPFLAQDPPVLLHPERVVPLSQSEQFERSYQPNVSLVPPTKTSDGITYSKLKRGVIRVRNETSSPHSPSESGESSSTSPYLCKDSRLTEKMEVKIQPVSPSDSPLPLSRSPHTPAPTEPLQDNGVNSFVEHIAAVLDALGDAEDAVRQRVVQVVERMTLKIKHSDLERQKYREEMAQLRVRMSQLEDVNMSLFCENTQLRQQLEQNEENHVPVRSPSPSPSAIVAGNSAVTTSYLYSNRNTPGISSKQPICSPVSVITSPPPSLSVIRSESAA